MAERLRLDAQNPWPGLAAFGEEDQDFFRGREREADELARLVRRERLTVLFGRSGLGKSSLLSAGLFPRLRVDLHLPVYLRIGYAAQAAPRQQVWDALAAACAAGGVQGPPPEPGESLWAYFHRAGAGFWNPRRRPLLPVLVFDQFEEIFTLGQADDAKRAVARAFVEEVADLIEDRPSEALRRQLDAEPARSDHIDFERRGCKVLLSFREDFLAEMEGLRSRMPSLMRNRFRLLPMDGAQARAVIASGGALVGAEVAERIIGLAWRNRAEAPAPEEAERIEIDPALLSVICSELNLRRRASSAPAIEADLLAGAEREILVDFYERSLQGLDPAMRHFVEDELITAAGYRDSYAYDDALDRPGVTSEALERLVAGRLLRFDERFGVRRLELTHDILTRVVQDSRDTRKSREAEAAANARQLAQQRDSAKKETERQFIRLLALLVPSFWFVVGTAILLTVSFNTREAAQAQMESRAQDTATSLGLALTQGEAWNDPVQIELLASSIFDKGYFSEIEIKTVTGAPIFKKRAEPAGWGVPAWFVESAKFQTPRMSAVIMNGWQKVAVVEVAAHPGKEVRQLWQISKDTAWMLIVAAIISQFLVLAAVRWALRRR